MHVHEEQEDNLKDSTEVLVLRDSGLRVRRVSASADVRHVLINFDFAEHLHADHGVHEKEHYNQEAEEAYVGQRLERLINVQSRGLLRYFLPRSI